MGEKTTLTVSQDTLERFKQRKETAAEVAQVPEPNADEFVTMLLNCWDNYEVDAAPDDEDDLRTEFDRLRELIERVPERTADEIEGRLR